jgi:ATP-dependent helicase HrpB
MLPLPIDEHLPQLMELLRAHGAAVLVAQPGAGKTTRVPPALLRSGLLRPEAPEVLVLQPRRVAARASAARIAAENHWELGREVGYHVRADRRIGPQTHLQILTEGILTRRLVHDPFLERVGCVILDEFHERHLDSDLCLAMLREIRRSVREDLLVVVMSATLDAQPVSSYMDGCGVLEVPGRLFPVELSYAPPPAPPAKVMLPQHAAREVRDALGAGGGDVLVFLPGVDEIRRTQQELEAMALEAEILQLHGSLTADAQYAVLDPSPRRKVILATNIAETSLTIDGVTTVIDSGLARVPQYDARRGMDRLELQRISRASATQRAGRAGRTAPGRCIRLWSPAADAAMDAYTAPEVKRVDLCSAVLSVHEFGKRSAGDFEWLEKPEETALQGAERLLELLGALHAGGLTPLGKLMRKLPLHPRLARVLIAASEAGQLAAACQLAALLSEKDIVQAEERSAWGASARVRTQSDVLLRLEILARDRAGEDVRGLGGDRHAVKHVLRIADDLLRQARRALHERQRSRHEGLDVEAVGRLLLLAYPDRICQRRRAGEPGARLPDGTGVRLHPSSSVTDAMFFVAVDARDDSRSRSREAVVRIASAVEPQWLEELLPHAIREEREVAFDESRERVVVRQVRRLGSVVLSEKLTGEATEAELSQALAAAVRGRAREIFTADPDAAQLLERVAFLRAHMPEQALPPWTEVELGEVLAQACSGKRSLEQVRREGLADVLRASLPWPLPRLVDEQAPRAVRVPSGSEIRLEYSGEKPPVLAVRLQEVFGLSQTPRLAAGRVPLLLHLLAPNYRPVQVTSDLASFWRTAYFQVRKDLRARYPKHAWPEDPLTALPEAKGRRRH